jgi:hypothetical protein
MQWQVDGADRQTGEDKAFLITADTEAQARTIGEAQDIYVSTVVPYVDPDYAPPSPAFAEPEPQSDPEPPTYAPPPPPKPKRRSPPPPSSAQIAEHQQQLAYARPGASAAANTFADVPAAARRLRAADWVLSIVGLLYVVVGVLGMVFILVGVIRYGVPGWLDFTAMLLPAGVIAVGVLLLGVGAALRMVASIGIASAEIARRTR